MTEWGNVKPHSGVGLRTDGANSFALDGLVACLPIYEGAGNKTAELINGNLASIGALAAWNSDRNIVVLSSENGVAVSCAKPDGYYCHFTTFTSMFRFKLLEAVAAGVGSNIFWASSRFLAYNPSIGTFWYTINPVTHAQTEAYSFDIPWNDYVGEWLNVAVGMDVANNIAFVQIDDTVYEGTYVGNFTDTSDIQRLYLSSGSTAPLDRMLPAEWEYCYLYDRVLQNSEIALLMQSPFLMFEPWSVQSDQMVGMVRESSWSETPTTGEDPLKVIDGIRFFGVKREAIQAEPDVQPQVDDMNVNREVQRIVKNNSLVQGNLNLVAGMESLGYYLTAIMGAPSTSILASGVYQHVWYPGQNPRDEWPVPYSIESKMYVGRSKLLQGAVCTKLPMFVSNNGPMLLAPVFTGRKVVWLYPSDHSEYGSGTIDARGNSRPAFMTDAVNWLSENYLHFVQIAAFPQVDGADAPEIISLYLEPKFQRLIPHFTGGSGAVIGSFSVDDFVLSGRMTMLFQDETMWEKVERGLPMDLAATFNGDPIDETFSEQLAVEVSSAVFDQKATVNQVGELAYDFGFAAKGVPSCRFALTNSTSGY